MAASINKVSLLGNLGRDPEVKQFNNGGRVVSLALATSEVWRDKDTNERKERTEWHRVSIYNEKIAEVAAQYLKKGAKIYIEGQLETRKWQDKDGQEKYTTEVVLRPYKGELVMLDRPSSEGAPLPAAKPPQSYAVKPPQSYAAKNNVGAAHNARYETNDFDDGITF